MRYEWSRDGTSFSRANSFRPYDKTRLAYDVWSLVLFASLTVIFLFGPAYCLLDDPAEVGADVYGAMLIGCGFLFLSVMLAIILLANLLRVKVLRNVNRQELRERLQRSAKSPRYVVSSRYLRSMRVGAIFFLLGACVTLCGVLLEMVGMIPKS